MGASHGKMQLMTAVLDRPATSARPIPAAAPVAEPSAPPPATPTPAALTPTISAVNDALDQMDDGERQAVLSHLYDLVTPPFDVTVSAENRRLVQGRAAELDADPSIGLSHPQVMERVRNQWAAHLADL